LIRYNANAHSPPQPGSPVDCTSYDWPAQNHNITISHTQTLTHTHTHNNKFSHIHIHIYIKKVEKSRNGKGEKRQKGKGKKVEKSRIGIIIELEHNRKGLNDEDQKEDSIVGQRM
jgi:hypothetical protein